MKHYDYEEQFHALNRKQHRKDRKYAQKSDRSKFKKTDQVEKVVLTQLPRGRVVSMTGERILVDHEDGTTIVCSLKGQLKKDKSLVKNLIAVGDWVRITEEGSIADVEPRTTILSRVDITGKKEQVIATNVDQLLIVVSVVEPPLKPALVDRYLIAAEKGGLHPIVVINKIDLLKDDDVKQLYTEFLSVYERLGLPIVSVSSIDGTGVAALRGLLQNKTTVVSGQSGVGKSSLLNAAFQTQLKVGQLTKTTSKGAHTTATAELVRLPGGGYCVDTPGIRSFAVWQLTVDDVKSHFHELALYAKKCHYADCNHTNEPTCAVRKAFTKGKISAMRFSSYEALLSEAFAKSDKTTWD
ncbi:MAG: putative ribosome biosis GTPase RsgA [Chlamydiota bacterium]|jgi:ribosome biogenesis GTPase